MTGLQPMSVPPPVYPNGTDYEAVRRIRLAVAQELSHQLSQRPMIDSERREFARHLIEQQVLAWSDEHARAGRRPPDREQERAMAAAVEADLFGLGRLQPLLEDDAVENIEVNGYDKVHVIRREGHVTQRIDCQPVADSDDELIELVQRVTTREGQQDRSFSRSKPILHLRLDDGSRLDATAWVSHRPSLVIRRHRVMDVNLDGLVELDMVDTVLAEFLRAAVKARLNLIVTGDMGAGKTTLIRALCNEIDSTERIATIEKEYELGLHRLPERHERIVALEAREATAETDGGQITLDELLTTALRLSLTRVIVGEVLGNEILPMLQAMSVGAGGSMCTTHGRSAPHAIHRMALLCQLAMPSMPPTVAYQLIADAVDMIVHIRMIDESGQKGGTIHRFVAEILELHGGQSETGFPATTTVFGPGPDGRGVPMYRPSFLPRLQEAGFDPALLDHEAGLWRPWHGSRRTLP